MQHQLKKCSGEPEKSSAEGAVALPSLSLRRSRSAPGARRMRDATLIQYLLEHKSSAPTRPQALQHMRYSLSTDRRKVVPIQYPLLHAGLDI